MVVEKQDRSSFFVELPHNIRHEGQSNIRKCGTIAIPLHKVSAGIHVLRSALRANVDTVSFEFTFSAKSDRLSRWKIDIVSESVSLHRFHSVSAISTIIVVRGIAFQSFCHTSGSNYRVIIELSIQLQQQVHDVRQLLIVVYTLQYQILHMYMLINLYFK